MPEKILAVLFGFALLVSCGDDEKSTPTKLEGSWKSDCVLNRTSRYVFEGENFAIFTNTYSEEECRGVETTQEHQKGTFKIGKNLDTPPETTEIDLFANRVFIYTIYKLTGSVLFLSLVGTDEHDGTTKEKRIDILSITKLYKE